MLQYVPMNVLAFSEKLLETSQQIVKWFKTQTTNEYIKGVKHEKYPPFEKHLWQRGYYEHIIRNQQDLDEIRRYIENNPAKWVLEGK